MSVAYKLDGIDFRNYGVYVSESDGIINRPKLKSTASASWDNYHGEAVDLRHKFCEPREITLSCFIKSDSKNDFITKVFAFERLFDRPGTNLLTIEANPDKPLIYEVYCRDEIAVSKKWSDTMMVGTFKLKLTEPEPVKRVLRFLVSDSAFRVSITLSTVKLVNIYWGDGKADFDLSGQSLTVTHDYSENGMYYPVVTGCIEEIERFESNAMVVWERV